MVDGEGGEVTDAAGEWTAAISVTDDGRLIGVEMAVAAAEEEVVDVGEEAVDETVDGVDGWLT